MRIGESLIPEFEMEMAGTRKVLERIPSDKFDWKIHDKSNSIGWVASHLADIPSWVDTTISHGIFDVEPVAGQPYQSPTEQSADAGSKQKRQEHQDQVHASGWQHTHQSYVKGKTPEQNHSVFFYKSGGTIKNVTIEDCLMENFSGDCISFSQGCRNFTVRNIRLRNFSGRAFRWAAARGMESTFVAACHDLKYAVHPSRSFFPSQTL